MSDAHSSCEVTSEGIAKRIAFTDLPGTAITPFSEMGHTDVSVALCCDPRDHGSLVVFQNIPGYPGLPQHECVLDATASTNLLHFSYGFWDNTQWFSDNGIFYMSLTTPDSAQPAMPSAAVLLNNIGSVSGDSTAFHMYLVDQWVILDLLK